MTQLELLELNKPLADLYVGLETDLIQNIADYLATQNLDAPTAQWKINALAGLGKLDKKNLKTIAEYAGIAPDMLYVALESAALGAVNEMETSFKKLAKDGIIKGTAVPIEDSISNALAYFSKQATEQLNLVNTVMQYKARKVVGQLIKDTAELSEKQSFLDMLNKATGKTVLGIESRQVALRECIKDMTEKGIPCFVDKAGREWSPEAYMNMEIRTTCGNVAHQAQFDRMDDYDTTLIEVSSHAGSRPKCAKDQGQIFDRKNKSKKYRHWSSSSYGQPDGILGINCGHQIYPFIEGVSIQRYFPYEDEEETDRLYKQSQQQRQLERNVRARKRELNSLDALGDKDGFKQASVKLKKEELRLKQFCNDTGRKYKPDRTAVPGYNKSISAKATAENKKLLTLGNGDAKIGLKIEQFKTDLANGNINTSVDKSNQQKHLLK